MKKYILTLLSIVLLSSCAPTICEQHIKQAKRDMKKGTFYK